MLDVMFRDGRTHHHWLDKDVSEEVLREAYDLTKMGPTSANCCPMRVVFVKSAEAKERLKETLAPGNVEAVMSAPVCAIIAHDMEFYEQLPKLYPQTDARSWFAGNEEAIQSTAFRNGTLQGGYFMLACRAVGLDCGPMSGFDNEKVDQLFLADTTYKSNFICNLGYGDIEQVRPRNPRLTFEEACSVV